jgi:hypothetical protein
MAAVSLKGEGHTFSDKHGDDHWNVAIEKRSPRSEQTKRADDVDERSRRGE